MRAALLLGLLAVTLLFPGTVRAHAELLASDPAANASLPEPPERLTLTFSEPIDLVTARVALLDNRQAEVPGVGALNLDPAGSTATAALPSLEPGTYTVSYQVTSATDGHITAGIFAFLVDPTGSQPPPTLPTETSSPSSAPEVVAARWLALASALAVAGTVLFWLVAARPALSTAPGVRVTAP
ncbi:MAG TPA: copper resistance CopC family protein, partial [Candidatus Dormibacteraeota bacterium]|nr:copper resistance CopC family protein [Candidatus Dormibacteraeota bacterium]